MMIDEYFHKLIFLYLANEIKSLLEFISNCCLFFVSVVYYKYHTYIHTFSSNDLKNIKILSYSIKKLLNIKLKQIVEKALRFTIIEKINLLYLV